MKTIRLTLLFMVLAGIACFMFSMSNSRVYVATVIDYVETSNEVDGLNEPSMLNSYIFSIDKTGEIVQSVSSTKPFKLYIGDSILIKVDENNMASEATIELYSLAFSFISAILLFIFYFADSKSYNHRIFVK